MFNGGKALDCSLLSEKEAVIRLKAQRNLIIYGEISNFINPISNTPIENMEAILYDRRDQPKVQSVSLVLTGITA